MTHKAQNPTDKTLAPPRGAAIAGIIFSVLMIVSLGLVRYAVPADLSQTSEWLSEPEHRNAIRFALVLVPFSGISFLWFVGVLRARMGELEDQFFATVFFASGLLFVASLFVASSFTGALVESVNAGGMDIQTYHFARRVTEYLMNLFAMKMAAVFMFSACTIGLRTAIFPRWVAFVGYSCAAVLLLVIANWRWITLLFPGWMLLLSSEILLIELGILRNRRTAPGRDPRRVEPGG